MPGTPFVLRLPAIRAYVNACRLEPPELGHELPTPSSLAGNVTINTAELDPDTNIGPASSARIIHHSGSQHVYDAAGALCGRLSTARMRSLWTRFQQARNTGVVGGAFETEVCNLLRRVVTGVRSTARKRAHLRNHWATPTSVMHAMRALTGFDTECFGSPLSVQPDTAHYFTDYVADRVFGATHNATDSLWPGSVQLTPEYTPEALLCAVRQAVACAQASPAPFLAVAVLPVWPDSPFSRVLARHTECCHTLAQAPAGFFNFERPEYATQGTSKGCNRARFAVQIVLIYNPAGLRTHLKPEAFDPFCRAVTEHAFRTRSPNRPVPRPGTAAYADIHDKLALSAPPDPDHPRLTSRPPRPWMKALIKKLKAAPVVAAPPPPPPPADACAADLPPFPFAAASTAPALGTDPATIVYVDASLKRGGPLGCGVYDAPRGAQELSYCAQGSVLFGELLSIAVALSLRRDDEPIHILSDSLVGLIFVNQAVFFASSVSGHAHAALLRAIAGRVRARTAPTTLGKVRGHSGVRGNVKADACARKGATPGAPPIPNGILPPPDGVAAELQPPRIVFIIPPQGNHRQETGPAVIDPLLAEEDTTPSEPDDDVRDEPADTPAVAPSLPARTLPIITYNYV